MSWPTARKRPWPPDPLSGRGRRRQGRELDADALVEVFEDHFSILRHVLSQVSAQLIELQKRHPDQRLEPPSRSTPLVPASRDLDLVERIFLLRQAAPFRRSSINALAELSRGLTEARFESGVRLWREGDAGGWMLLVVNGAVAGHSAGRGQRFLFGPGSPLGVLEGFSRCPRLLDAVTETRVVALQGRRLRRQRRHRPRLPRRDVALAAPRSRARPGIPRRHLRLAAGGRGRGVDGRGPCLRPWRGLF